VIGFNDFRRSDDLDSRGPAAQSPPERHVHHISTSLASSVWLVVTNHRELLGISYSITRNSSEGTIATPNSHPHRSTPRCNLVTM